MQAHPTPPPDVPPLADAAAGVAAATATVAWAADRHRDGDGDGDGLAAAAVLLRAVDRIIAAVIAVLQSTGHRRVIAARGVTRDTWLRAVAGRTGADAGMLLAAAERLVDMPAVTAWFHAGALSWGAVRGIVSATRNLTAAQRTWVDQTLAEHDGIDRLDGDQVAAAVDGLVARARPELQRDREATALSRRWLSIQPRLDGTAAIHGSLDPETAAAALAAFGVAPTIDDHNPDNHDPDNHNPDNHNPDGNDHDRDRDRDGAVGDGAVGDGGRDGVSEADWVRAARGRANVDIFGDLCRQRVTRHQHSPDGHADSDAHGTDSDATDATAHTDGIEPAHGTDPADGTDAVDDAAGTNADRRTDRSGGPAAASAAGGSRPAGGRCGRCGSAPSSARPAFLVVADLAALDPDAPVGSGTARLHWATSRSPVELTPAAAQRLACDATLRAVVTDGAEILGVTATHPKVSATLRAALVVRDGGCRFPGCAHPAELCDAHHLRPVADGGATTLANLALLCRGHHHALHDGGWHVTLHAVAAMTFTRRGITRCSVPRAGQHPTPTRPPPAGRPHRRHHSRPARRPPDPGQTDPDADTAASPDPADALLPF